MKLRSYQHGAVQAAFKKWLEGIRSVLVVLATGLGKTRVAAECAKLVWEEAGKRTLFIVHLREIVRDARDGIATATGLPVGMELSSESSSTLYPEPIICASVQTLNGGRLNKFDADEFGLIVVDESHHSITKSWQNVINYFPNAKVLCLTATPERADGNKLGSAVDAVAYDYGLKQGCQDGWLVKPRQLSIEIPGLDFSKIPRKQGDYSKEELGNVMVSFATMCAHRSIEAIFGLHPHELDDVAQDRWSEYIGEREPLKTLIFCVTRLHAEKVSNALNSFRDGLCGYVDGETPHMERRDTFRSFKHGSLPCLATVGTTLEGYDNPFIRVLLVMRPSMSHGLVVQMIGRITRTLPGTLDGLETAEERLAAIAASEKPYGLVVDFTSNSRDHRLVTVLDIFGDGTSSIVKNEVEQRAKENAVDIEEEIEIVKRELSERYAIKSNKFDEYEIDGFTGKIKKRKLTKAEKAERRKKAEARPISPKELELLRRQKLKPEKRTHDENRALLKKIKHRKLANLCSFAQGFVLKRHGYTKEQLEKMKSYEAKSIIDSISQREGWKSKR